MSFTHLHVHTGYSLLDGAAKINELVDRAKELGMDSIAITDHGVMYGAIDFYKKCHSAGIKPIIGCEIYTTSGSRFEKEVSKDEKKYNHLVLLAESNKGYENLMKIVSRGFTEGFYYKPRVDYEILREYSEGIIALSACLAGVVPTALVRGDYEKAKEEALKLEKIFGKGNFFLELQDHGIVEQQTVNQGILRLHSETDIPLVATNDCHYIYAEDAEAHDILLCIQTQKKQADENRMRYDGGQYYFKSEEEMRELFPYAPEAIENTAAIAKRCNVEIVFNEYKLPHFDVPEGYTSETYLRKLCDEGLKKRYENTGMDMEKLKARMEYELDTIKTMGFVDYFLIVWDFIKYAKDHDIPVGPGRGSAAGSIVSYVLEITDIIDPIKYNLLFERFLNPERVTMPDIDVDFCIEGRQAVIDYVSEKYGKDKVVQIVTFGTMASRMVIRDVGRVLDLPYAFVDKVAKSIPAEIGMNINKALKVNPEFREMYEQDETVKNLVDMSRRLEGLPRHTSFITDGVVISPRVVDDFVPLSKGADGTVTTQYTMTTLEELGLLKMDFLGLRNLTVIKHAVKSRFSLADIDYNDKKVYKMISEGKTEGVFQLESTGMKNFMKELKPESMEDVIAGISLYRPGPKDFIPKYTKVKNDKSSIVYDCEQIKSILEPTYGCIVYQEQVMQIVRDLAGYSYGRSDLVRRAMSKKKADVMQMEKKNFIYGNEEEGVDGCLKRGISEEAATKIFDEMVGFAEYAFNKSHAAAYAVVAYQTAYLKYYYPLDFMSALLTSVMDKTSKVVEYTEACKKMNIEIMPPNINICGAGFAPYGSGISYGLAAIKSVGTGAIEYIEEERKKHGDYISLTDFCKRVMGENVNKKAIESLIKAGALDCLEGNRRQKLMIYENVMDGISREKKQSVDGQLSFFDINEEDKEEFEVKMPDVPEFEKDQLLAFEKDVLGLYISGHPMEDYAEIAEDVVTNHAFDFMIPDREGDMGVQGGFSDGSDLETGSVTGGVLPAVRDREEAIIAGMVVSRTVKTTKKGTLMAFITIEDLTGSVEVIVFPQQYEAFSEIIREDKKLLIKGRTNLSEGRDAKLICSSIVDLDHIPSEIWIRFDNRQSYVGEEEKINRIIEKYSGKDSIIIYIADEKKVKRFPKNRDTEANEEVLHNLGEKYGDDNVRVVKVRADKLL